MESPKGNMSRVLAGRGFTLIELLIVIAIIGVLLGITLVGLSGAVKFGRAAADSSAGRSLRFAVEQFDQQFGFQVPLAYDGEPLESGGAPVPGRLDSSLFVEADGGAPVFHRAGDESAAFVGVYSSTNDLDYLRGVDVVPTVQEWSDPRYSKSSLAVYLTGSLPASVDGVEGPGTSTPRNDGSFARETAAMFEPLVEPGKGGIDLVPTYASELEYEEHGAPYSAAAAQRPYSGAVVDRGGVAFRYYRWENGRNSLDAGGLNSSSYGVSERAKDLNIPLILQDPEALSRQYGLLGGSADERADATDGNTSLRSASWAVVGAGPDGLFGTEPINAIADQLGEPQNPTGVIAAELRRRAMADNVVEVGR